MKSWLWMGACAAALAAAGAVGSQPAAGPRWVSLGDDHEGRYYYDPLTVERMGGMIRFRMRAVPQPAGGDFASAVIQVELNCGEQSTRFRGVETFDARGTRIGSFGDGLPRPEGIRAGSPEAAAYRRLCPRSLVRPLPAPLPPPLMRTIPVAPPPPPMAPMPPPLVRIAPSDAPPVRARWRQNPSVLISNEDYPAAALRAEEQGPVAVRLDVSPDGRVTRCTVTASSGSASLDSTTCILFQRRARFTPARNARGESVADSVATALLWSIPPEPKPEEAVPPGEQGAAQPPPEQS